MERTQTQTVETFDQFMAAMYELRKSQEETDRKMQETFRQMRESQEATNQRMRESQEATDRRMRESQTATDRQISRLGSRLGELIEHLAASNIVDKFKELGYQFTRISRNHILKDEGQKYAEIDILLENGDYALAVEVKSLCTLADAKDHLKRMEKLRGYADRHQDRRHYRGAVAGALMNDDARDYALAAGLYVIEQSGDTVHIKAPSNIKTWSLT